MFNDDETLSSEARRLSERNMPVTPLDVRQAKFATVVRGFDRQEVMDFLMQAAEGYDMALRENERLRQEVTRLEGSLTHFRDLEASLKNTLVSAQKFTDDLRDNAAKEGARITKEAEGRAELVAQKAQARLQETQREIQNLRENSTKESARIIREAEGRADAIVQKAQSRLADVQREIDSLKIKRRETETSIESTISALTNTLTFIREQDQRDRQDKVLTHRPRVDQPIQLEPPKIVTAHTA